MKNPRDIAIVDLVYAYCAVNTVDPTLFQELSFGEALERFHEVVEQNPEFIVASKEVRKYYDICHWECHVERIIKLVNSGLRWPAGSGPNKEDPKVPVSDVDNVVDLATWRGKTVH